MAPRAADLGSGLALGGRLNGPTGTGSGTTLVETLPFSVGGAATATTLGLLRAVRRTTRASARLGTSLIDTSDGIVAVEGNAYFPLPRVPAGVLHPSSTTRKIRHAAPLRPYLDGDGGAQNHWTTRNTVFAVWNMLHTAWRLKDHGELPVHGNVTTNGNLDKSTHPNPEYR